MAAKKKPSTQKQKQQVASAMKTLDSFGYQVLSLDEQRCICCNKVKKIKEFYVSYDERYLNNFGVDKLSADETPYREGKTDVCKDCMKKQFLKYYTEYNDIAFCLRLICQQYGFYYNEEYANRHVAKYKESLDGALGMYIGKANSMKQWRSRSYYKDTLKEESMNTAIAKVSNSKLHTVRISDDELVKLEKFWGMGYTEQEYVNFQNKYENLRVGYTEKTALHTEGLQTYVRYKVKEEMSAARNDVASADKWGRLAAAAAKDNKINAAQLNSSDIAGGVEVIPQLVEAVEERVSLIPIMPKLKAVPYDDIDMNIYALTNYYRRLEDKPPITYPEVWAFTDKMIYSHFADQGYSDEDIERIRKERNAIFKDLGERYSEPLYFDHHEPVDGDDDE